MEKGCSVRYQLIGMGTFIAIVAVYAYARIDVSDTADGTDVEYLLYMPHIFNLAAVIGLALVATLIAYGWDSAPRQDANDED